MKGFRQYITERLAIEDNPNAYTPPATSGARSRADIAYERRQARLYGGVMARVAAQELAKSQSRRSAKTTREPFPWQGIKRSGWTDGQPGWWHPTKQWFTFNHNADGFHVTQIVKSPQKFGISKAELDAALMREANYLYANNVKWYDADGERKDHNAESVRASILKTDIDLAHEVQLVAYKKGWLKVYGKDRPSLEGTEHSSAKAALREIGGVMGEDTDVVLEMLTADRNSRRYKSVRAKDWNRT